MSSLGGRGPWFLDADALKELDEVFEKIQKRVVEEQEAKIAKDADVLRATLDPAEADERVDKYLASRRAQVTHPERSLKIAFGKDRVTSTSFALAEDECAKREGAPTAFDYTIADCGALKLDKDVVRVEPDHAKWGGVFVDMLRNWLDRHRPSRWLRIWNGYEEWSRALGPLGVIVGFLVSTVFFPTDGQDRQHAHTLLLGGVKPEELTDAVETLLRLQLREPVTTKPTWTRWLWFGVPLLYFFILTILAPAGAVAVSAKASHVLKARKARTLWIGRSIPAFLILTVLAGLVERLVFDR